MPTTGRGDHHSCVGNPCLSLEIAALLLEFAALLPRKKELRNDVVPRSQAGKLQNELINWTETVTGASCTHRVCSQVRCSVGPAV